MNRKWFRSTWTRKGARINPRSYGWYAAKNNSDRRVFRVFIEPNLLDCFVEESPDLKYDVYDFDWWYPLQSQKERLPEFHEQDKGLQYA